MQIENVSIVFIGDQFTLTKLAIGKFINKLYNERPGYQKDRQKERRKEKKREVQRDAMNQALCDMSKGELGQLKPI